MPNHVVKAAAEGLPMVTRRFALGMIGTSALPIAAMATPSETPKAKVERLAEELALALDEYEGGSLHATVFPASTPYGVKFTYTNLGKMSPEKELEYQLEKAKAAMSRLYPNWSTVCRNSKFKDGHAVIILMTSETDNV